VKRAPGLLDVSDWDKPGAHTARFRLTSLTSIIAVAARGAAGTVIRLARQSGEHRATNARAILRRFARWRRVAPATSFLPCRDFASDAGRSHRGPTGALFQGRKAACRKHPRPRALARPRNRRRLDVRPGRQHHRRRQTRTPLHPAALLAQAQDDLIESLTPEQKLRTRHHPA
jgi:hypothetical protein